MLGEYVLIFFIVASMMGAMVIYFRRTIQARMFDARNYSVRLAKEISNGYYNGSWYRGYEPYYANTATIVGRDSSENVSLFGTGSSTYQKDSGVLSVSQTNSVTAAPKDADKEYGIP